MFRKSRRPLAPRKTLTDLAYERIRDDILNGLLKPGESVSTGRIAKDMQISSMPVRAALARLHAEGLVVIAPQRGVTVSSISPAELEELFVVRSRLESLATYLACPHMTEADLAELRRLLEGMRRSEKASDMRAWLKGNERFHRLIFRISQNRKLERLLFDLWGQGRRSRVGARNVPGHVKRRNTEHEGVLKALENTDAELADSLMKDHILAAGKEIVEFIAEQQAGERSRTLQFAAGNGEVRDRR